MPVRHSVQATAILAPSRMAGREEVIPAAGVVPHWGHGVAVAGGEAVATAAEEEAVRLMPWPPVSAVVAAGGRPSVA